MGPVARAGTGLGRLRIQRPGVGGGLCARCPVIGQCLEWELRCAGMTTTGVWGATCEDDRRALHPIWRERRQQQSKDREGGPTL